MSEARRGPATTGIGVAFDITGEPILFNRSSSFVLKRQMEEVRKVYQRLTVLVILATVVLMLAVGSGGGAKRHRNVQRVDLAPMSGASTIQRSAPRA